ncbi:MAG: S8 family serine peptidase, partial [Candidatus Omnitrophica bacterium]|nr:S8 family serine peptidase [Candidatus Omnitrophota bacterium]
MKKIYLIIGIMSCFALLLTQQGLTEDEIRQRSLIEKGAPAYVQGEIIIKFNSKTTGSERSVLNLIHGTAVSYTSPSSGIAILKIPSHRTVPEMVDVYKNVPIIEYAEPNYIAYACLQPEDAFYKYQWHMDNSENGGINMEEAWDIETGNPNVIVAVLDTGVAYEDYLGTYYQAPDLADTSFVPGYDFVNDDEHPNDDEGHGTHVTGTIAQSTDNGIGVAGVAFDCSIMPVKVLDSFGAGTYTNIAEGIYFATDNGADIINLSLGGDYPATVLENALAYAYNAGVTIICASGNDGSEDTVSYPARYDDYCIAVGATGYDEMPTFYSNRGHSLDLVAPGGDISVDQDGDGYVDGVLQQTFGTTFDDWGYWFYEGTSMAAPHVSGVAALLIANGIATTPYEVRTVLQSTAEDKGEIGWDSNYGYGIVDAYEALNYNPIANILPTVYIYSISPNPAQEGQDVVFTGYGNDTDGTIEGYEWRSDLDGILNDIAAVFTMRADDLSLGTHTISFQVQDDRGDWSEEPATAILEIVEEINQPPTAYIDSIFPETAEEGEDVEFRGHGVDSDGTVETYRWESSIDGVFYEDIPDTITINTLSPGFHEIYFMAQDEEGDWSEEPATATLEITALFNQPPTAHIDTISPSPAREGQDVIFTGSETDIDGTVEGYSWESSIDGVFYYGDALAPSDGVTINTLSPGIHEIYFTVQDNDGEWSETSATAMLEIFPEIPPVTTVGRELLVDGEPYEIRGICWVPYSIGSTPVEPPNDYPPDFNTWYEIDIPLMREMGINTIRTYRPIKGETYEETRAILDMLHANEIKVIMGFSWAYEIANDEYKNYINDHRDHPAILMWEFGNEYNYHPEWFGNDIWVRADGLAGFDIVAPEGYYHNFVIQKAKQESRLPFESLIDAFNANSPASSFSEIGWQMGDASVGIVDDWHVPGMQWIKADFGTAYDWGWWGVELDPDGLHADKKDWSSLVIEPEQHTLRFHILGDFGATPPYLVMKIEDESSNQVVYPVEEMLGLNTNNQCVSLPFTWVLDRTPAGFDWSDVKEVSFGYDTTPDTIGGWMLVSDIQVGRLSDEKRVFGTGGHNLQNIPLDTSVDDWRTRTGVYQSEYGQSPVLATWFTTIFEPIDSYGITNYYSDIMERNTEISSLLNVPIPSITMEFRSWAQITRDNGTDPDSIAKIEAERARFNSLNTGGITYDDFINDYINQNMVLDAVIEGELDPLLRNMAREMSGLGPVYLRLFHEPYFWFPWGMRETGDVEKFKQAWDRIGQIFFGPTGEGANNVMFVMTLDPYDPGFSVVDAIPYRYIHVIELDCYTDPVLRQNADLSANELSDRTMTEIEWQLTRLYPDPPERPTVRFGEFAFTGNDADRP